MTGNRSSEIEQAGVWIEAPTSLVDISKVEMSRALDMWSSVKLGLAVDTVSVFSLDATIQEALRAGQDLLDKVTKTNFEIMGQFSIEQLDTLRKSYEPPYIMRGFSADEVFACIQPRDVMWDLSAEQQRQMMAYIQPRDTWQEFLDAQQSKLQAEMGAMWSPTKAFDDLLAEQQRHVQSAIGPLTIWPRPEREPEPFKIVHIENRITPERIDMALDNGSLTESELRRLLLRRVPNAKPGPTEPLIEEQLVWVQGWYAIKARRGKARSLWGYEDTVNYYCGKIGISRATLYRYEKNCKELGLI